MSMQWNTRGPSSRVRTTGWITALLVALLAAAAPVWAVELSPDSSGPTIGAPAPQFTLVDAQGKSHSLKDYAGKIVVLEWTNPDCPFVQRHYKAKTMIGLAQKFTDKGVVWLAINSTHYNKPADTEKWTKEQGLPYLTLLDPSGEVGHLYGAKTTPHMYVIDKDGMLAFAGAIDDDPRGDAQAPKNYVAAALTSLLAGTPIEVAAPRSYGCSVKYTAAATKESKTAKSTS
jgi:peroxiredoxin